MNTTTTVNPTQERINTLAAEIFLAAIDGDVDKALKLAKKAEKLAKKAEKLQEKVNGK